MKQFTVDTRQWILLQGSRKDTQRLAALLLAMAKGMPVPCCENCSEGKISEKETLDIHHTELESGSKERQRWTWQYYGVLATRFLNDIIRGYGHYAHYRLLCRKCHKLVHGACA